MGVKFVTPPCQISPPSVQQQGCNFVKFLLRFDQNVEYKHPAGAYPLRDFHRICRVYTPFQNALAAKIWLDLLEGLWSYVGFKLRPGLVPPDFQCSLVAKLCVRAPKVLEVQERAQGPLSPCQVWWGSDFTRVGVAKNVEFFVCLSVFLFVCLFVRHAFEHQRLFARFRYEGVGVQKRF